MEQLQIAYLPRRGTEERWRRLWQEIAELRRNQFAEACQQAGITSVQISLLQLLHSELLLVTVQLQEPMQAREVLASSQSPFARWFREQLLSLLGWDVQQILADPPSDLLFIWKGEGDEGYIQLVPEEVSGQRYMSFYKEDETPTFRRQSETIT